ncbi:MAG: GspE/PulE family protein [Acidobacteriota bacterium]
MVVTPPAKPAVVDAPSESPRKDSGRSGPRHKLGAILVKDGALTSQQLAQALIEQSRLQMPLGRVLITLNYLTEATLRQALSQQFGVPFIDLDTSTIDRRLARIINKSYARRHSLLPVAQIGATLTVAMDDPTDTAVIAELRRLTQCAISPVTASSESIQAAFSRLYDEPVSELPNALKAGTPAAPATGAPDTTQVDIPGLPRDERGGRGDELVRTILNRALDCRASDLHLEMLSSTLRVRFRIDGVLRLPDLGSIQTAINRSMREVISRIKILAKLDIAERRRPQDGSFQMTVERAGGPMNVDLRVSVIPSYYGESVVIRVLDRSASPRSLEEIELSPVVARRLKQLLSQPTGIFLVTGPTGSGKSTTLSACLSELHRTEIRILTAEDPVEYVYDELSQSEINPAIGNTFATYLRAFLRHDPEVIMLGEIRDQETAEMAFRAAQTGHLLLSTMHTNSAIAALPRLFDLQIEPSLIASSLIGVVSQRLARRICPQCRRPAPAPPERASEFFVEVPPDFPFVHAPGCEACGFTGYRGRMLLADLWVPDEADLLLITKNAPFPEIRRSAMRTTFSMAEDANVRLKAGMTTIEELLRVLPYDAVVEHRERFGKR